MPYSISKIIVLFFVYSFIGWICETCYCSIKDHHFDNRGILVGPYCPIYGFTIVTTLICTKEIQNNLFFIFWVGLVIATAFEYFTSLILEKVFHIKLWDYSKLWGNIHGTVAPMTSILWAIAIVLTVKYLQPFIQTWVNIEEKDIHGWLAVSIIIIMGIDLVLTIFSIEKMNNMAKMWDTHIDQFIERVRAKVESRMHEKGKLKVGDWHHSVIQHYDELQPYKLSWNHKRMLKNFSNLTILDAPKFMEIKKDILKKENN